MPLLPDMLSMKSGLAPARRLLGLDVGEKTIGLALSDLGLMIATPMQTIRRTKFAADLKLIATIITDQQVGGLIIGLPINMDASEGPRAQSIRQFARNVLKQIDLPVVLWDERLSTMAVTRILIDADTSRARRAELVDKMAAAYILQGALDRMAQT
jgi:putative holliday junction resolvase